MIGFANTIAALRHAGRSLRRSPAFTVTVVATLGIGIGLNAAIFTVVDCVLLRPLGYRDADRIVALQTHFIEEGRSIPRLGGGDYTDAARQVSGLEATAHFNSFPDGIQMGGTSLYVPVAQVSPRFAEIMGVQPIVGRLFRSADLDGTDVLLSAAFTRAHFASAGAAIGQLITYNGAMHTVVGVLPAGFSFPGKTEVWFERPAEPANANRSSYSDHVIGKRRPGVTTSQLNAELATFSANLRRQVPEDHNKSIEAVSLQEHVVGSVRPLLHLLMGAVVVLLLIVCANVTHLQLVRATRHMRSVSIRTALGASRQSLAAYALVETALLAIAGTATAFLLVVPSLHLLVRLAPPDTPRLSDVHLNVHIFLFSLLIALAVMVAAAMLPIWHSWQVDPASALRSDASRGTETRSSLRLRNGFIIAEVALTLTLSVSAILLTRQLIAQSRQNLGFSPDTLLTLDAHAIDTVPAPVAADQSPEALAALKQADLDFEQAKLNGLDATLASVAEVPWVQSVGAISGAPMGFGGSDVGYAVRGRQVFGSGGDLPHADFRPVSPGFMQTMQIPLLQGRALTAADRQGSPGVVLVSRELVQKIFPGQDPVGKQIMCGYDAGSAASWLTIVGVVEDIRSDSPAAAPSPTIYAPVAQHPNPASDMQIIVRTRTDPAAMVETLRRHLKQTHPEVAVKGTTMRQNIGDTERTEHFRTLLFGSFAGVSILLAAVGMYGMTAYTVSQRRFEFGLRMALGSNRSQLLGLVLRKALGTTLIGIGLGAAMSLGLTRVFGSVVGKLPAFDATAYALAALTVLLLSVLATLLPARSAATTDPNQVLRSE